MPRRVVLPEIIPVRQPSDAGLAAAARAWHFSYDAPSMRWLDDKGTGDDLYAVLARVVLEGAGVDVTFS